MERVTRRLVAAWLLEMDPYITDERLNRELQALNLPNDKFVRKDGSHYRRLWKRGRLPPCPESDPRKW